MDINKSLQIKVASAFNFGATAAAMNNALSAQVTAAKVLHEYMEPMRKSLQLIAERMKRWIEIITESIMKIVEPLRFLFTFKPIYYVPRPVGQTEDCLGRPPDKYLLVEEAEYGYFKIDGNELKILNPSSSKCGRLLQLLLNRRAEIVDYKTLREHVKTDRLDKDFKDLKWQLSQQGYKLDYDRPPGQGIAAKGLVYLQ